MAVRHGIEQTSIKICFKVCSPVSLHKQKEEKANKKKKHREKLIFWNVFSNNFSRCNSKKVARLSW